VAEGVAHLSVSIRRSIGSRRSAGSSAAIDVEPTLSRLERRYRRGADSQSARAPLSTWSRLSVGSGAAIDVEPTLSRLGRRLRAGATFASTNRCLAVDEPPRLHSPGDEGDRI